MAQVSRPSTRPKAAPTQDPPSTWRTLATISTEVLVSISEFMAAIELATASSIALDRVVSSAEGMEAAASWLAI